MRQQQIKLFLAFMAIYVIWGSTYIAIRYAVETIPPFFMMGTRSLIAGSVLYLLSRLQGNSRISRSNILPLFTIGAMFFLVGHGLLAWAQQYLPSGLAAVLVASEPFWIVGIEYLFLRDIKIKAKGVLGLIIGFAGVVYLVASTEGITTSGTSMLYAIAVVVGALSWGGGAVYSRVANLPKSPVLSSGMELIFGGVLLIITGFIIGEGSDFRLSEVSLRSGLSMLYLVTFGSVVAFGAYVWLLNHTSATRISTHTYVNPVIAVFLGWLIADEQITTALIIATIMIVISVYLVLYNQKEE